MMYLALVVGGGLMLLMARAAIKSLAGRIRAEEKLARAEAAAAIARQQGEIMAEPRGTDDAIGRLDSGSF
jgi:hypothetical protein